MVGGRAALTVAVAVGVLVVGFGCGSVRETLPARSAMEQLLISTAADRAVGDLPDDLFAGKKVFLDVANLDCVDKAYVTLALRNELLASKADLVKTADDAEVVLEAASGALSLNKRDFLIGLPALPLPIPYGGETIKFPEIPLWKWLEYKGRAKLLLCVVDREKGNQIVDLPIRYGKSQDSFWWLFVVGPIRSSDLPEEVQ